MDGDSSTRAIDLRAKVGDMIADKNNRLSQAQVAGFVGFSGATISQWLGGKYPGDVAALERKIAIWLEQRDERLASGQLLPDAPTWIETPTALKVLGNLRHAQMLGDITIIYGGAGLGKTTAIARYQSCNLQVWVATMTPAHEGVVTSLSEIAQAMDLSGGGGAAHMFSAICKRVRGTAGLIVVDEAQHLSIKALDQIRAINDATGVGITLSGNESVYARMSPGQRQAAYLDRIYSRVGKRTGIKHSTHDDLKALLAAWQVTDEKCHDELYQLAKRPGALRTVTKVLRIAAMYAVEVGEALCCTHIRTAVRELGASYE